MDLKPEQRVTTARTSSTSARAKLPEAVEAYCNYRESKQAKPTSVVSMRRVLRRFAKDVGSIQMQNLKPTHVWDWFYGPLGQMQVHRGEHYGVKKMLPPIGPATHNQYMYTLKAFFEWARARGMIKVDLLEDVDALPVPKKVRLQPSPDVMLTFLDSAIMPRDRGYLAMAMNTALRASEILRMRVGDLDLERGTVHVTRSKGGAEDDLPVTADLDVEMRRWLTAYAEAIEGPLLPEHYLFPLVTPPKLRRYGRTYNGQVVLQFTEREIVPDKPWGQRSEMVVQRALAAAGLPTKGEGTHTIRRAVARAYFDNLCRDSGYDNALRTTSALLGHTLASTTERYLGLSTERTRRDETMKGKPFLSGMTAPKDNVIEMRR